MGHPQGKTSPFQSVGLAYRTPPVLVANDHNKTHAGVARIDEVILAINIFDVDIIVVVPIPGPRLRIVEPEAAVVEAIAVALHMESML